MNKISNDNICVSVIVPTYKPKSYLWDCLDSLIKQTFPKNRFEIVLILNGCDEPYNSQIHSYLEKYSEIVNICYLKTNDSGVSNARNIGIENSRGQYICFIDDDDYVSETYLQSLYEVAKPGIISISNVRAFIDGSNKFIPYSKEILFSKMKNNASKANINSLRQFFAGPCMKLIPRNVISNTRFDTGLKNGEDSLFMFLISKNIQAVSLADSSAIYYRRFREGSAYTAKKSLKYKLLNRSKLSFLYSKAYFSNFFKYNLLFFVTRQLACIKAILKD